MKQGEERLQVSKFREMVKQNCEQMHCGGHSGLLMTGEQCLKIRNIEDYNVDDKSTNLTKNKTYGMLFCNNWG